MNYYKKLLLLFDKKDKIKILILLIASFFGAIAETASISVVLPYVNIIMDPLKMKTYPLIGNFISSSTPNRIIILASIALFLVFILKNIFLFFMYLFQARFTYNRHVQISYRLLRSYLLKPYAFFFNRNIAEMQRNFSTSIGNVMQCVLLSSLALFCELLVSFSIFIVLLFADIVSTLVIGVAFGGIVFLLYKKQKKAIIRHGKEQQDASFEILKWVNQSILGIKEIKVKENYDFYLNNLNRAGEKYAKSAIFNNIVGQAPRLIIEIIAIGSMSLIVVLNIALGKEIKALIPVLSLFALGAYRLMPSFSRVINYITIIRFNFTSLDNIYKDLNNNEEIARIIYKSNNDTKLVFNKSIQIKNVNFRYDTNSRNILNDISFTIDKGSRVGIIGESGQGKTTLIDCLLALLTPNSGDIFVDGKSIFENQTEWHKIVSYIPQNIYLNDDTIINNICLGVSEKDINIEKVNSIIETVKLSEFIATIPDGLNARIGDNGICISGGQKQRIAIARALYNEPQIIIMDEATSALDNETEAYIAETLNNLGKDKTFIIVAHRLSSLNNCDVIHKIEKGMLQKDTRSEVASLVD